MHHQLSGSADLRLDHQEGDGLAAHNRPGSLRHAVQRRQRHFLDDLLRHFLLDAGRISQHAGIAVGFIITHKLAVIDVLKLIAW